MSHKTFSMIGCGDVQSGNSWSKKRIATLPTVSYYHLHSIATTFFFLADFFLSFFLFLSCLYIISRPMHIYTLYCFKRLYFSLSCVLKIIITYTQSPETFRLHFFMTSLLLSALQVTLGGQLQACQYLEIRCLH